jgi:hypothetical protein
MPYAALALKPGIDVEKTRLLNSASWSLGDGVRFFQQMPQKAGGWTSLNITPLTGISRGLHAWADLNGTPYIASGSALLLQLYVGGLLYDITPLRATTNPSVKFTTISGSQIVTINDTANGALAGDYVNVFVPVSVGGISLYGNYLVQSVVDADHYTIAAPSAATASVTDGGAVPSFTTTLGSPDVVVTLANHGIIAGSLWPIEVSTSVGGFTLLGSYVVVSVTTNTFIIQPGATASSGATVSENSGNARLQYPIHSGATSASLSAGGGFGVGGYGSGPYGVISMTQTLTRPRTWCLYHYGQDLIGNYNGSPLFVWDPTTGPSQRALVLNTTNFPGATNPPTKVNFSIVVNQEQMIVCFGCDDVAGNYDPNLIRWCSLSDFTDWFPTTTNQAGSFHVPSGSRLVGAIVAPNFIAFWTDVDMWIMSYIGGSQPQLVWSFNKIADGVDLIAPNAIGLLGSTIYWPSFNGFYAFDGAAPMPITCPVWDKFWANLNKTQIDKVNIQCNSVFNEISWGFPSASGNGEVDQRITIALDEPSDSGRAWTYDSSPIWARTSWINNNVYGTPIGADVNGFLDQHETSNDANGIALPSSIQSGWFAVQEGTLLTMMERLEGDLIVTGGTQTIQITVYAQDYPTGPIRTYGPFIWTPGSGPPYSIVRARGRFFSIKISSSGLGVFWRLGHLLYNLQAAGTRP